MDVPMIIYLNKNKYLLTLAQLALKIPITSKPKTRSILTLMLLSKPEFHFIFTLNSHQPRFSDAK